MADLKKMKGLVFGRLTVLRQTSADYRGYACWVCRCECGNEARYPGNLLRTGKRKSCGRCRGPVAAPRDLISAHPLSYGSWRRMLERCSNPNDDKWPRYGGRGITACERWRTSLENFVADMGDRPSAAHSIGRRDNDGNYEPGNCRWETDLDQQNNKSNTVFVEFAGRRWPLAEFCRHYGYPHSIISTRLKMGWSLGRATTEAVRPKATAENPGRFWGRKKTSGISEHQFQMLSMLATERQRYMSNRATGRALIRMGLAEVDEQEREWWITPSGSALVKQIATVLKQPS